MTPRTGRLSAALVLVIAASMALALGGAPGAQASSAKPPPVDPGAGARAHRSAASLPDRRRNPGLKAMLSLSDADRTGDSPALSALCQDGIGKPNPYARTFPNIDQIVRDGIVSTGTQTGCSTAQNENTIAVNPNNPRNLVAGTNDYRVFNSRENRNDGSGLAYTTLDGGRTWKNVQLPHLTFQTGGRGAFLQMDSAGDPAIAFGPHNTVYYANIVFSRGAPTGNGTEAANGIALNVSHDGGLHWDEPVLVQVDGVDRSGNLRPTTHFNDKVWVAADERSGRVYVTWSRFTDNPDGSYLESPIVVANSSDYGRHFGSYRRVDTTLAGFDPGGLTPYSQGSNPKVGRDGTLYIAYEGEVCDTLACENFGTTDRDVTVVATSHDHGLTFRKAVVDTNFDFPLDAALGTSTLTGENFRINSFPQLAYDKVSGQLALTWADDRHGSYDKTTGASIRTNGDNLVSLSADGRNWTRPLTVGTAQDEVFGAVAIRSGVVALTSYTRHYAASGVNLDYAYWSSVDLPPSGIPRIHRITTQSSNPQIQFVGLDDNGNTVQGTFIGDYTAVALGSDLRLHPCWTDFRGHPGVTAPNQDSYTQSIPLVTS